MKEILAEKVHSIFAREKARDLYDLFFLLRFVEPDKKIIEKKLALFDMSFDTNELRRKINNLERVWELELRPFVLADIPGFSVVRDFVFSVVQRTSFGGVGANGAEAGATSVNIEGSVVQRSEIGSVRMCPNCGKEVQGDERFCLECGARLG